MRSVPKKLSTRFALLFAVLVPLLVLLAGVLVLNLVSGDLRAERDRQLTARLRALAPTASAYSWRARILPELPPDFLRQRLAAAAAGAEGVGGIRLDVAGAEPLVIGDAPTAPPGTGTGAAAPPGTGTGTAGPADLVADGRRWRFVTAALGVEGRSARLSVFEPDERLAGQLALLRRRLAVTTLLAAAAGAVAGFGLGRFAVRPLAALHRQARTIDLPPRAGTRLTTTSGVAEIDELAQVLNRLLDRRDAAVARTGEALEAARAFAATAAHELRTPLTSMGTNLSLLGHPGLDPRERSEIVADLAAEHGRTHRLITMLRRLAQGELLDPATFTDVELTEVVTAAVEDARRRHPHAVITVSTADDVPVRGWAEGLRVIADNLLDNAAVHGADGHGRAEVTVTLSADGGTAVLSVRDGGPGIAPADRERVFTRFHRRAGSPGSGLGLTLVRQQATLHGGTAAVAEPGSTSGTRIEVRLPMGHGGPAETAGTAGTRSWLE
ncbi:HAMP domain-containing sensor histidine kinase [Streptosporangium sp. NPDC048047]|uniref:sensor histidine kinase n=1 Tax=Streptosporangium sp. NPDC048047 TaxID=3155748 RepID=UPI00342B0B3B